MYMYNMYIYIYIERERERERDITCDLERLCNGRIDYVRNILGWLKTRLAQNTLDYLHIA